MAKKFSESGQTAVFTTKFVIEDGSDITTVYHDADDGAWQFLSSDEYENFEEVARVVSLDAIIEIDSSLLEISDLPPGFMAFRPDKSADWEISES
jgi:hypothetical protein